jgi:PadR family transcriptional regulator, regulatory protein PadR
MGLDKRTGAAHLSIDCRWEGSMKQAGSPPDLLPGTLEMLILQTLGRGPMHGYGIAERLQQVTDDVLQVGESSLYPALQRLLLNGWVKAEWGTSENNRRARYYTLTAAGRRQLIAEREEFARLIGAIQRVLGTA